MNNEIPCKDCISLPICLSKVLKYCPDAFYIDYYPQNPFNALQDCSLLKSYFNAETITEKIERFNRIYKFYHKLINPNKEYRDY